MNSSASRLLVRALQRPSLMATRTIYTLRRALMYVPANDARKIAKIPQLNADCVCLDCEDGVPIGMKSQARESIHKVLTASAKSDIFGHTECTVRVNSVDSGLCEDDLREIFSAPLLPAAVNLPKIESPEHLEWFSNEFEKSLPDSATNQFGLLIFIESAKALIGLRDICEKAKELKSYTRLRAEALVFGSEDFGADIGAIRTPGKWNQDPELALNPMLLKYLDTNQNAVELLYARQKLVTIAKAYGMQAIDLMYIDYNNLEGLRLQSEEGARMGYTGKQVIHRSQVGVVQQAFTPSVDKIKWATDLIKQFQEYEKSGRGPFEHRGYMVDLALVKQAQNIVDMKHRL